MIGLIIMGLLAGIVTPFETAANTKAGKRMGHSLWGTFLSFSVGTIVLVFLVLIVDHGIHIPFEEVPYQPWWIWTGGIFGIIYVFGNIILMPKIGSMQTIIFPLLGQVTTGLIVDHFGLFRSNITYATPERIIGVVLVFVGVVLASADIKKRNAADAPAADVSDVSPSYTIAADTAPHKQNGFITWLWRLFGIFIGCISTTQIAINGYLGDVLGSSFLSALISFAVGTIGLIIIIAIVRPRFIMKKGDKVKTPWWMWTGGFMGAYVVFSFAYLAPLIGTGVLVIVSQLGMTLASVIIDHFGIWGSAVKRINALKVIGLILMIAGAVLINLVYMR